MDSMDNLLQNINSFIDKMETNNMPKSWQKIFLKQYITDLKEVNFQNIDSINKVC